MHAVVVVQRLDQVLLELHLTTFLFVNSTGRRLVPPPGPLVVLLRDDRDLEPWLRHDLLEYRLSQGRRHDEKLIFQMQDGRPWNDGKWRRFRDRIVDPAVERAKVPAIRPYDLRHARASQLIASGASVVEVASQLGHSPTMCLNTYSHVISDFKRRGPIDLEAEVRTAREGSPEDATDRLSSVVAVG